MQSIVHFFGLPLTILLTVAVIDARRRLSAHRIEFEALTRRFQRSERVTHEALRALETAVRALHGAQQAEASRELGARFAPPYPFASASPTPADRAGAPLDAPASLYADPAGRH